MTNPTSTPGDDEDLSLGATAKGFRVGQKLFQRYTLQKILGRGGMGVVWLAGDEQLDRLVALKFLPDALMQDRQALEDLKYETKKALGLNHHHIVRIHDLHNDGQYSCISMEYVDGQTLGNLRFDRKPPIFSTRELTPWANQLCDALAYAHETARIVHRDLKPANLMVNERGELKVADFGISRSLSDSTTRLTGRTSTSGTLVYMSPQHLDGKPPSVQDDIYALGATLYELVASKPPFYTGSIERQIHDIVPPSMEERRRELEIANGDPIPPAWEQTIAACLAKDPAERPQSAKETAAMLRGEIPVKKTKRVAIQPAEPKPQTKGKLAIIAIAVLVVVIGIFAFTRRAPQEMARASSPTPKTDSAPNTTATPAKESSPEIKVTTNVTAVSTPQVQATTPIAYVPPAPATTTEVAVALTPPPKKVPETNIAAVTPVPPATAPVTTLVSPPVQTNLAPPPTAQSSAVVAVAAALAPPAPVSPAPTPAANATTAPKVATPLTPTLPFDSNNVPAEASAFTLVKLANERLLEPSRDKIVQIISDRSKGTPMPTVWRLIFYDASRSFDTVEVRFRAGKFTELKNAGRVIERLGTIFGSKSANQPLDAQKLLIDSDLALQMALKQPGLEKVTLASSRIQLELRDRIPVWRIELWVKNPRNQNDETSLGEIFISPEDAKVIINNLHPERVN